MPTQISEMLKSQVPAFKAARWEYSFKDHVYYGDNTMKEILELPEENQFITEKQLTSYFHPEDIVYPTPNLKNYKNGFEYVARWIVNGKEKWILNKVFIHYSFIKKAVTKRYGTTYDITSHKNLAIKLLNRQKQSAKDSSIFLFSYFPEKDYFLVCENMKVKYHLNSTKIKLKTILNMVIPEDRNKLLEAFLDNLEKGSTINKIEASIKINKKIKKAVFEYFNYFDNQNNLVTTRGWITIN